MEIHNNIPIDIYTHLTKNEEIHDEGALNNKYQKIAEMINDLTNKLQLNNISTAIDRIHDIIGFLIDNQNENLPFSSDLLNLFPQIFKLLSNLCQVLSDDNLHETIFAEITDFLFHLLNIPSVRSYLSNLEYLEILFSFLVKSIHVQSKLSCINFFNKIFQNNPMMNEIYVHFPPKIVYCMFYNIPFTKLKVDSPWILEEKDENFIIKEIENNRPLFGSFLMNYLTVKNLTFSDLELICNFFIDCIRKSVENPDSFPTVSPKLKIDQKMLMKQNYQIGIRGIHIILQEHSSQACEISFYQMPDLIDVAMAHEDSDELPYSIEVIGDFLENGINDISYSIDEIINLSQHFPENNKIIFSILRLIQRQLENSDGSIAQQYVYQPNLISFLSNCIVNSSYETMELAGKSLENLIQQTEINDIEQFLLPEVFEAFQKIIENDSTFNDGVQCLDLLLVKAYHKKQTLKTLIFLIQTSFQGTSLLDILQEKIDEMENDEISDKTIVQYERIIKTITEYFEQ